MIRIAYILSILFVVFLITPSVVAYIDNSIDVSVAYNVNEEESSSQGNISFEYHYAETQSNYHSIHFLPEQDGPDHFYDEAYPVVDLDVLSPPPKRA